MMMGFCIIAKKIAFGFSTSFVGTNVSFFVERAQHMEKSKFHVLAEYSLTPVNRLLKEDIGCLSIANHEADDCGRVSKNQRFFNSKFLELI